MSADRCPLCWHSADQHKDGTANQELNTMGCASCRLCEITRMSLAVVVSPDSVKETQQP